MMLRHRRVGAAADKKRLVFVVNAASAFSKAAEAGMRGAERAAELQLTSSFPEQSSTALQTRLIDDLVAAGVSASWSARSIQDDG